MKKLEIKLKIYNNNKPLIGHCLIIGTNFFFHIIQILNELWEEFSLLNNNIHMIVSKYSFLHFSRISKLKFALGVVRNMVRLL